MPRSKTTATNIGMVFLHTLAYYRRALRGIWRYAEARPRWEFTLLLPPVGVRCRRSSEVLAIDDESVAAAVRFVRAQAHRPLQVEDVLKRVPVGRRTLERRFRKCLGWGVAEEIQRTHLMLARQLLAATDLSVQAVAIQAGFSDYRHMTRAFHRQLGITPTAYREQVRISSSDPSEPMRSAAKP